MIRLFLVDDHEIVRRGVAELLGAWLGASLLDRTICATAGKTGWIGRE